MIAQAERTGLYGALTVDDMLAFLATAGRRERRSGDRGRCAGLSRRSRADCCAKSAACWRRGGLFAFTVETHAGDGVILGEKLRYAHGADHVRAALAQAGLAAMTFAGCFDAHRGGRAGSGVAGGGTMNVIMPPELPEVFLHWFAARGWAPRAHQLELLRVARAGRSALLIAPTGAGKTLAGFLPSLVELSAEVPARAVCSPPPRARRRRA